MLPDGIELTHSGHHRALTATADLRDLATERFAHSAVRADLGLDLSAHAELLGFAFTQFAMPVIGAADVAFDFAPAHNLRSPKCTLPLIVRDGKRHLLIAPLTNPHEQIITVEGTNVTWGWHGDLDEVPTGFSTVVGVYEGISTSELLTRWAAELREHLAIPRRERTSNVLSSHLSYWTDNGAAYWYRTEPGRTICESVIDTVDHLDQIGVAIGSVELDSWFYDHELPRAITTNGYPDDVPPSGLMRWQPRHDAAPAEWSDGVAEVRRRVNRPLVLHTRHLSPASPDVDESWWVDDLAAHPSDPDYFSRWFDTADHWGATCIEQDWMLMYWFGVREMRRIPGRAIQWQAALDANARRTDIDLVWCMATPADMIAAAAFDRVIAVRTSDDYRFTADPALLWTWFLTVNRLIAPLGLWPFKDCFFSHPEPDPDDSTSGDRHAETEALLSALSGGPVGIGDRIGRTDIDIVRRTCDANGRLHQPDTPIGLIDDCLFGAPARGDRLAWATASTTVDHATWTYVVALNTSTSRAEVTDTLGLAEIGIDGERHVYDWRTGTHTDAMSIGATVAPRDWAYFIVCPAGSTDVGDTSKYVTVASR